MRRTMLCMLIAGGFVLSTATQAVANPVKKRENVVVCENAEDTANAVQFGFWFDVPRYTKRNDVHGFRWGLPFSGTSSVKGFDWSLFGSHIKSLAGLQIGTGYCGASEKSIGAQLSLGACISGERFDGIQISLFNKDVEHRGWQCGVVNLGDQVDGAQHGVVNIANILKGFNVGIVNIVTERCMGPQIGLVNYSNRSNFQLGLININKNSVMPFMILFNFSK